MKVTDLKCIWVGISHWGGLIDVVSVKRLQIIDYKGQLAADSCRILWGKTSHPSTGQVTSLGSSLSSGCVQIPGIQRLPFGSKEHISSLQLQVPRKPLQCLHTEATSCRPERLRSYLNFPNRDVVAYGDSFRSWIDLRFSNWAKYRCNYSFCNSEGRPGEFLGILSSL